MSEDLSDKVDELLEPLPSELMRLAGAFSVISIAGLLCIVLCATYFAVDMGVYAAIEGESVTGAFSVPTFLTVAGLLLLFIMFGGVVDEQLHARADDKDKTDVDPFVLIIRVLFIVPHLVILNIRLLRDALQLRRSTYDIKLALHLMEEAKNGVFLEHADHEQAPAVFRSTLVALERAHLIERHYDNDERLRLTVEGFQLLEG